MVSNIYPIRPAIEGARIARAALSSEEMASRLYNMERAAIVLLDRVQRMRREHELSGELHTCGSNEALDHCAVMMAGVMG